eukprot:CAMPEP_0113718344 /NCGR_PEP_ID=MMETSP0038_2-20120614/35140_1 /TAXON_ID=2898 /ORGANISM="Cryptomonas paramecium" /LENGTH=249 /DNA_ID=CAMNT_0000646461 /DNA_START=220 /DNA_END=966 /DNA_ORIENTATION=+ /assembly_acc=CAM_ASM_000170
MLVIKSASSEDSCETVTASMDVTLFLKNGAGTVKSSKDCCLPNSSLNTIESRGSNAECGATQGAPWYPCYDIETDVCSGSERSLEETCVLDSPDTENNFPVSRQGSGYNDSEQAECDDRTCEPNTPPWIEAESESQPEPAHQSNVVAREDQHSRNVFDSSASHSEASTVQSATSEASQTTSMSMDTSADRGSLVTFSTTAPTTTDAHHVGSNQSSAGTAVRSDSFFYSADGRRGPRITIRGPAPPPGAA